MMPGIRRSKFFAVTLALVLLATIVGAVLFWQQRADVHAHEDQGAIYYCPMHPTITSDSPGNCPICGMSLVRRSVPSGEAAELADAGSLTELQAISLSPSQRIMGNVATTPAVMRPWSETFTTTGTIQVDETRRALITSYTSGRIERLYVDFVGDTVRRGAPVATIYSPELYATQQEYMLALANRERMRSAGFDEARTAASDLVASTRRRLQLLGMSEARIRELEAGGTPPVTTTITAPVSGIVTSKNVVPQQYVQTGQALLEVADLSTVWVEADVYEKDLAQVAEGQSATVIAAAWPDSPFEGRVSFVEPVISGATRSNRVRIELPNPDLRLKPGMFARVVFDSTGDRGFALMVPRTAIVDRGDRQFVWVEIAPGQYEPRQVSLGGTADEYAAILQGVRENERVVVQGGFLLDSESRLRQATAGAEGVIDDPHDH